MRILITGATGLLGSGLLCSVFDNPRYDRIYLLLRPGKDSTVQERFRAVIQERFPPEKRELAQKKLCPVAGDLTLPGLGLSADERLHLVRNLHQVLHSGADTRFTLPLDGLRQVNCEGTRALLALAQEAHANGQFVRFDFVSTAFVAGTKAGTVTESELERGQAFSNNYEQSKYETECLIRRYRHEVDFPITVYRPSIVVGKSDNGYTTHFRTIYWPLKMLASGIVPVIPIQKSALLDVVPCDYVVNSMVSLMQSEAAQDRTFHLTAGEGNEITIGGLLRDLFQASVVKRRPVLPMWMFRWLQRSIFWYLFPPAFRRLAERAEPYVTYLTGTGVRFQNDQTLQFLNELGVAPPRWDDYKDNIFAFAIATRWGEVKVQPDYHYLMSHR